MVTGIDLLTSRRRAGVTTTRLAGQMGVTRQYVSKLEGRPEVTPEAAEGYRAALRSLEDGHVAVTIHAADLPPTYRAAAKVTAVAAAGKTGHVTVTLVATPEARWEAILGATDALARAGVPCRVAIEFPTGTETLRRV